MTATIERERSGLWRAHARVDKFNDLEALEWARRRLDVPAVSGDQLEALGIRPDAITEAEYNLLVNNGIARLEDLLIGVAGIAAYTNAVARIGVGNGAGTAAASDTDLSAAAGAANRWFQVMDATYPSRASQTVTFKATFGSADGNFAWNEWGIDGGGASSAVVGTNGAGTAALLNHKTSAAQGTKAAGQVWAFTTTLVIA